MFMVRGLLIRSFLLQYPVAIDDAVRVVSTPEEMAGNVPGDQPCAGRKADKRFKPDSGFGAWKVVLQLLHSKCVAGKCFEVPLVDAFHSDGNGALELSIKPFDLCIGIALKADEFMHWRNGGRCSVIEEKHVPQQDTAGIQVNGDALIRYLALGASLACLDEMVIQRHVSILSAQTYGSGTMLQ